MDRTERGEHSQLIAYPRRCLYSQAPQSGAVSKVLKNQKNRFVNWPYEPNLAPKFLFRLQIGK